MLQGTTSEVQALIEANPEYSNDLDIRPGYSQHRSLVKWKRQAVHTMSVCRKFINTGTKQGRQSVFFYDQT
jgi:hypothetical protein